MTTIRKIGRFLFRAAMVVLWWAACDWVLLLSCLGAHPNDPEWHPLLEEAFMADTAVLLLLMPVAFDWQKIGGGFNKLRRKFSRWFSKHFRSRGTLLLFRPLTAETVKDRIYRVSDHHYYVGYMWFRICSLRIGAPGNGWTWVERWIPKTDPNIRRVCLRES